MCHKPSCDPVPRRHSPLKYTNLTSPATTYSATPRSPATTYTATPRPTGDGPRETAHGRRPTEDGPRETAGQSRWTVAHQGNTASAGSCRSSAPASARAEPSMPTPAASLATPAILLSAWSWPSETGMGCAFFLLLSGHTPLPPTSCQAHATRGRPCQPYRSGSLGKLKCHQSQAPAG